MFSIEKTKGRIAESLVQELFAVEGYEVTKFGLENLYPGFYKKIRDNKDEASNSLRKSPDLVLLNPCNNEMHYAEVKYRTNGKFSIGKSKFKHYDESFPECLIFLVSPTSINCLPFSELRERRSIDFNKTDKFLLKNNELFDLRNESIENFEKFATMFFNKEFINKYSEIRDCIKKLPIKGYFHS
ncbi:hypothetical protein ATE84_2864 [Aquimarina sp. MAR_2010_214]|uniref:hypothetical protein n=1 Tax=Aquimarina sp. MAR_2010_214 TaxID=1250026 RepID=UPI000C706AF6|nr:hypothetical protein [Aquimarina sp. MAR_2010_214]PKV50797.1 hypothetical protein ATE84_2864 [Aquimarina sp. MAR_2010_214]